MAAIRRRITKDIQDTRGDKDKKMEASCGAVTLVPASSDSVDETGVEPEKQEVKVSKG